MGRSVAVFVITGFFNALEVLSVVGIVFVVSNGSVCGKSRWAGCRVTNDALFVLNGAFSGSGTTNEVVDATNVFLATSCYHCCQCGT